MIEKLVIITALAFVVAPTVCIIVGCIRMILTARQMARFAVTPPADIPDDSVTEGPHEWPRLVLQRPPEAVPAARSDDSASSRMEFGDWWQQEKEQLDARQTASTATTEADIDTVELSQKENVRLSRQPVTSDWT